MRVGVFELGTWEHICEFWQPNPGSATWCRAPVVPLLLMHSLSSITVASVRLKLIGRAIGHGVRPLFPGHFISMLIFKWCKHPCLGQPFCQYLKKKNALNRSEIFRKLRIRNEGCLSMILSNAACPSEEITIMKKLQSFILMTLSRLVQGCYHITYLTTFRAGVLVCCPEFLVHLA